eukprot:75808-Amphidinium_carterae.1
MSQTQWSEVVTLSQLPAFRNLDKSVLERESAFKAFCEAVEADTEPLPHPWEHRLNQLQRLCVIRALRIDCLVSEVMRFVGQQVGRKYVEPPTFDIAKSFADSSCITPLIFILSP